MMDWPRVGVGMLIVDGEKILLARRKKAPEANHWGILGGKLEKGEILKEAAIREAEEECGMRIGDAAFLVLSEQIDIDGQHWISAIFTAREMEGSASITEQHAFSEMDWFGLDQLPAPLTVAAGDALRALKEGV
ncbi:MAG: NUDIX domain-containing protein [Stappiaceae bacterium]